MHLTICIKDKMVPWSSTYIVLYPCVFLVRVHELECRTECIQGNCPGPALEASGARPGNPPYLISTRELCPRVDLSSLLP